MVPSVSSVANLTNLLSICTTVVLLVICLVGDRLDRIPSIQGWVRALADSGTHGAVGAISWLIVLIGSKAWQEQEVLLLLNPFASFTSNRLVCEVVACGMVALFIDIDHFIAAGSFDLKAGLKLPGFV